MRQGTKRGRLGGAELMDCMDNRTRKQLRREVEYIFIVWDISTFLIVGCGLTCSLSASASASASAHFIPRFLCDSFLVCPLQISGFLITY